MQWFLNLSTRGKLFVGFGSMIALLAAVVVMAYWGISAVQESQKRLYQEEFVDVLDMRDIRSIQTTNRADLLAMLLQAQPAEQDALRRGIDSRYRRLDEEIRRLIKRNSDDPETLARLREFDGLRQAVHETRETQVYPLVAAGKLEEARRVFAGSVFERDAKMQAIADVFVEQTEQSARAALAQSEQAANEAVRAFGVVGMIAVLLGIAMVMLLNRVLAAPLKDISAAAERIAAGDLTVDAPTVDRADETGVLMQTFHRMVTSLREVTREITEGVNVLAASAAEITAATAQVAAGSAETASALSETTTTVEEVKQTAELSTQKARHVSETAQKSVQTSQSGKDAVNEAIEVMHRIQEQMGSIAESIVRLSEQGQAIGEIIATVNDLAEQSNLLAVNAAIEAAKAGEQGKGFAVVAQEVKNLAEQSKQATAQVRTILGDIQKATTAAVMATEQGTKAVESGVKTSSEVANSIGLLAEAIAESAQAAMQIAASAQQQFVGMDQVALAMQNIKQASAQNVDSTKQTELAARNLNDLGGKLKQVVARYRV